MSHLPIPLNVVYAGLAGAVISLIVATATNKWSPRVFLLLTLRLAIGWHFAFEGLHKIHSYYTGPTDTNRPFTSEPYFKVAPGPLGEMMRKKFSDPDGEIASKVKALRPSLPRTSRNCPFRIQAAKCPEAVAKQLDALESSAKKTIRRQKPRKRTQGSRTLTRRRRCQERQRRANSEERTEGGEWSQGRDCPNPAPRRTTARRNARAPRPEPAGPDPRALRRHTGRIVPRTWSGP